MGLEGQDLTVTSYEDGVMVNGEAKVIAADNAASNGVVHIIDAVLLPPTSGAPPSQPTKNIVALAQDTESLSTLVTALQAGNLVSALQATGPFSVFAPTNAAFGELPAAELSSLLEPGNVQDLVAILTYHVVSGAAVYSKDLKASQNVKTLEGQDMTVTSSEDGVMVNGKAKVIAADNAATNGVVHIIDAVLLPPTGDSSDTKASEAQVQAVDEAKEHLLVTHVAAAITIAWACFL